MTSPTTTSTSTRWTDHDRISDITTAAALLALYLTLIYAHRALVDTSTQFALVEAIVVAAMLALTIRSKIPAVGAPITPVRYRDALPYLQQHRRIEVVAMTAATFFVAFFIRAIEPLAELIWPPSNPDCDGTIDAECCSYNDPACTDNDVATELLGLLNASIGEELLYRVALLTVIARYTTVKIAIAAQAVIWGLSHTGFENGYGAPTVVGIIAVGIVYALSMLATRSVWPAIIAHALHNLAVTAGDYDLTTLSWITFAISITMIAIGSLTVWIVLANRIVARRKRRQT